MLRGRPAGDSGSTPLHPPIRSVHGSPLHRSCDARMRAPLTCPKAAQPRLSPDFEGLFRGGLRVRLALFREHAANRYTNQSLLCSLERRILSAQKKLFSRLPTREQNTFAWVSIPAQIHASLPRCSGKKFARSAETCCAGGTKWDRKPFVWGIVGRTTNGHPSSGTSGHKRFAKFVRQEPSSNHFG